MKIALKYGLIITAVVILWVVVARFVLDVGADSKANLIAPVLFNVAEFVSIFVGIRERKRELGKAFTFKRGVKMGTAIAFVYATSACLFFVVEYFIAGPKLLMSEAAQGQLLWQVAAKAFAGLFFLSVIFGIIYSTLSAFVLAREGKLAHNRR